eukprot:364576-Chlamydomonas_euryale.AAC.4
MAAPCLLLAYPIESALFYSDSGHVWTRLPSTSQPFPSSSLPLYLSSLMLPFMGYDSTYHGSEAQHHQVPVLARLEQRRWARQCGKTREGGAARHAPIPRPPDQCAPSPLASAILCVGILHSRLGVAPED